MIVRVLFALTLVWGTLAFGGVYQWAYRPLLVLAFLTGVAALVQPGIRRAPRWVVIFALVTMAAMAVQLVPLAASTIARLSPASHRILSETQFGYAFSDARHPLSVSPGLTAIGIWFLITLAVFVAGLSQWLTRDRLRFVAGLIVILGAAVAVEALIQRVLSPTLVYGQPALIYGFWKPLSGRDPFGPFVNKNHFAGWMLMGVPVALGLAIGLAVRARSLRGGDWRAQLLRFADPVMSRALLTGFCALIMLVALMSTLSRSGISAAVVTVGLGAILVSRTAFRRRARAVILGTGAILVLAATWAGLGALSARFAALDGAAFQTRLALWTDAARIAADAPWTGIGIRAYPQASLVYQTALPEFHVGAAHNDWLQIAAEGGLLVGIPAACLLAALVREGVARFGEHGARREFGTTYWIRAGAACGLTAIAIQSLAEFSLQMPGNTFMFASLWAIVIAPMATIE